MTTTIHHRIGRLAAVAAALLPAAAWALPAGAAAAEPVAAPPTVSAEDAEQQASVLAAEDRRLIEVRTVTSLARWQGQNWKTPYRLGTATGYTLVLTPRSNPYTVQDLLKLAPQTFRKMSDGSYLLSEHLVVMPRATLRLSAPGGLVVRLASDADRFATIVSLGGEVELLGEQDAPVQLTSWDVDAGTVDRRTTDGRAYVRAIGGQLLAQYVRLADLGFWSGRTGGLSLTGTDRPNTGAIESAGSGDAESSLLDGITWQPAGDLQPGDQTPDLGYTVPAVDYASGRLDHVTVERNTFGLFVSGANGIQVTASRFRDNQMGGVVLHRFVTNAVIERTRSVGNVGDGFTVDRASTGVSISESTATRNSGSGFRLAGRPLAEGPSAVGASLQSYGNNTVNNSTATDNGRYGIELIGGFNIGLQNNTLDGHRMGILVKGPARKISIVGNTVNGSDVHGVALVDQVRDLVVTGNVVEGSATGVYLRDSAGKVKGNTVLDAGAHGISLVGEVEGSEVSYNLLAGSGASALDTIRSDGSITRTTNDVDDWHDTTPWYMWFKKLLQPMNALWSLLAILLVTSAVRSRRTRRVVDHPYAHQLAHLGYLSLPQPGVQLAASPGPTLDLTASEHRVTREGV